MADGQSPWVTALQGLADAASRLLAPRRAIRFADARFVLTDAPTAILKNAVGNGQIVGCTDVTISGVGAVDSVVGSAWIGVDSTDPAAPIVSVSPAPSTTGAADRIVATDEDGNVTATGMVKVGEGILFAQDGPFSIAQPAASAGSGAAGTIAAQDGTQSGDHDGGVLHLSGGHGHGTGVNGGASLDVAGTSVFQVYEEPAFGGAKVAKLGSIGGVAGLVIEGTTSTCEFQYYPKLVAGNGAGFNISGQDVANGNGGGIQLSGGAKGGGGTKDGAVVIGSGGVELFRADTGIATIGDTSNTVTPSVRLAGPIGTTAGPNGGADPAPANPEKWLRVYDGSTVYRLALYKDA